jgi:pSer/pThr/pTyr-binding forkhead associated (FHA) protein
MPTSVLTILKFCLLAVLYLFLLRVVRAVWMELRASDPIEGGAERAQTASSSAATERTARSAPAAESRAATGSARGSTAELRVVEPPERRGTAFPLTSEVTIGRAPGCSIRVDDTFASQLHARVFAREKRWYVEDLGSTNGTWLNRKRVHGPLPVSSGDRIAVGDTVLQLHDVPEKRSKSSATAAAVSSDEKSGRTRRARSSR